VPPRVRQLYYKYISQPLLGLGFHSNTKHPFFQNLLLFKKLITLCSAGSDGNCSMVFREGTYYSAPQRTNINAPPVLAPPGSSDSLHFVHGGYAPRAAPPNSISTYPAPAFATPNNSVTVTHEPDIPCYRPAVPGYPPATSAAAAAASVHAEGAAASSRHLGHVALGSSGSARSRRLRDSYHAFRPLVIEENNLRGPATEVNGVNYFLIITRT
jgi:hypothetical protein